MIAAPHALARCRRPVQLGDNIVHISASIGIILYPDHGDDADILITNADNAMYDTKKSWDISRFFQA